MRNDLFTPHGSISYIAICVKRNTIRKKGKHDFIAIQHVLMMMDIRIQEGMRAWYTCGSTQKG